MAAVGTYILANNTGNFDQLIMMTDILYQNITNIVNARAAQKMTGANLYPTIADIEQSHVIIPRNAYKPYVPVAFQYLKQSSTAGTASWGNQITFRLDNFGEFYQDAMALISLPSVTCTADSTSLTTAAAAAVNVPFIVNSTGGGLGAGTQGATYYRFVDSYMNTVPIPTLATMPNQPVTATSTVQNYVYYCDNLAHNLFVKHEFDVNSTMVDTYTNYTDTFYLYCLLPQNKLAAYQRCIGQEVAYRGIYQGYGFDQPAVGQPVGVTSPPSNSGPGGPVSANTATVASQSITATPVTGDVFGSTSARHQLNILNGPQTPKAVQPALTLIYPYKFDFCESPSNSLPVLQIPGAPREIKSTFNQSSNVIFTKSPVFLEKTNAIVNLSAGTAGPATFGAIQSAYTNTSYSPVTLSASTAVVSQSPFNISIYINNIFIDKNIHDIYIQRVSLALCRVHLSMNSVVQSNQTPILLSTFKWAVEYFFVGMQPVYNSTSGDVFATNWDKFQYFVPRNYCQSSAVTAIASLEEKPVGTGTGLETLTTTSLPVLYYDPTDIMTAIQITINTLDYFQTGPSGLTVRFFDSYTLFRVGGYKIQGYNSYPGFCMVNFCFYPGEKNPNGYVNVSRSRELYVVPSINASVLGPSPAPIQQALFVAEGVAEATAKWIQKIC